MNNIKTYNCPIEAPISLIGGKYKAIILYHLIDKTLRFNELYLKAIHQQPHYYHQQHIHQ
jgi:DNA-binding HxlR family transcriptional regulator